jgi:hypothetical protein
MTTDAPDVLLEMQAEARGYKRGLREAAERVWRREWKTKCSCDHVLVKKKLDILALIPADTAPSGMAETTPVADIAASDDAAPHEAR